MSDTPPSPTASRPAKGPSEPPHTPPAERLSALPQRLRRHVATLSLVGGVLVVLPVVQLLRYQSSELDTLAAGRARLDPVARAVQVQRGLMAHSEIAAQVLAGRAMLEPDRRLRQLEVDGRLAAMMAALASGRWDLAIGEADELSQDWRGLTQQIVARSVNARDSTQAHRLLVEQTLQVIDLVAIGDAGERTHGARLSQDPVPAGTPGTHGSPVPRKDAATRPSSPLAIGVSSGATGAEISSPLSTHLHTALLHKLPRLVWQTSQLAPAGLPGAASDTALNAASIDGPSAAEKLRRAQQIEATLTRSLGLLERAALASGAATASGRTATPTDPDDVALLRAGAAAGAATAHLVAVLRQAPEAQQPVPIQDAVRAAVQAQMQLFDLAYGSTTATLAAQSRQLAQGRALLMGGLFFLALLAAGLISRIWRGSLQWQDREREREAMQPLAMRRFAPADIEQPGQEPAERRQQTEELMHRLRDPQEPAPSSTAAESSQPASANSPREA